jgi:hypothetical protein
MLRQRRTPRPTEIFPSKVSSSSDGWWWAKSNPLNSLSTDEEKVWNAGRYAPAYIRFDFDKPVQCTQIDLLPCMQPESGAVKHEMHIGPNFKYKFAGHARDRCWIHAELTNRPLVKFVQIHTLESPSFVAWRRVRFWTTAEHPSSDPM